MAWTQDHVVHLTDNLLHEVHVHQRPCVRVSGPGWNAGGMLGASSIPNGAGTLSGRMKSYHEIVRSLNNATAARQPFQAIPSFAAAAAKDPDGMPLILQYHSIAFDHFAALRHGRHTRDRGARTKSEENGAGNNAADPWVSRLWESTGLPVDSSCIDWVQMGSGGRRCGCCGMCWRASPRRLRQGRGPGLRARRRCCAGPGITWKRATSPTCKIPSRPTAHRSNITLDPDELHCPLLNFF